MATQTEIIYDETSYKKLEFPESIRRRPGMYIGKLGNGNSQDDGIYILAKEAIDNTIDEFQMGWGKSVLIHLEQKDGTEHLTITDQGRGIPLGVLVQCASEVHGGAKFDSIAFQKSVGMNGVGIKAVNALSKSFTLETQRDGNSRKVTYARGVLLNDETATATNKRYSGTRLTFSPDETLFTDFSFQHDYLERMAFHYACLNPGLKLIFSVTKNGHTSTKEFLSQRGVLELLEAAISQTENGNATAYPIIQLKTKDLEICITHGSGNGEDIHSFVNGQCTHQGGTHVAAFREALIGTLRDFTKKAYEPADIRGSLIAVVSIRLQEPVFESQTKTKLGSSHTEPLAKGIPLRNFIGDFVRRELDNFLRKNPEVAKGLENKLNQNERERKELAGLKEKSRELNKKASLANRKLVDCKIHFNTKNPNRNLSTLFITEGDSAGGSITGVRDTNFQAVFKLKGKPENCFGRGRRAIYENEELHLLQSAIGIEDGIEDLRYNNIIIATDADVDGMHIRLLLVTFFVEFYEDLIRNGHVFVLQTPLFRIRNKKETRYCYSDEERLKAIKALGPNPEITRFKGLGEISPKEFKDFIGPQIRLEPLLLDRETAIKPALKFFMGPNTPERYSFLCENLNPEVA